MTKRRRLTHRRKEISAAVFSFVANKALSKKTTGLDRAAKSMIARQVGAVVHDPELDHPDEWDRPID